MERVNRSASFRSADRRSDVAPRSTSGSALEGAEKFFSMRRGAQRDDNMSDTSSQQERKYSALLGPDTVDIRPTVANSGPMNAGKRLYIVGVNRLAEKEEKLQQVREKILMKELSEMTQRPAITRKARQKGNKGKYFADQGEEWLLKKAAKLEELKEQLTNDELKSMQAQPHIDVKSSIIVENLEDYRGPVSGWNSHFAKFRSKQCIATPRDLFQPSINSNAVRVDIEKNISDRLFEESAERTKKAKQRAEEFMTLSMIDPVTGRPLFQPQPLDATKERRSPDAVTRDLVAEGERIIESKKKLMEKLDTDVGRPSFSPTINKKSKILATTPRVAERQKPLHEPKKVMSPSREASTRENSAAKGKSPIDSKRGGSHVDPNDFLRRIEIADQRRIERLGELQTVLLEEEKAHCTFQPRISKRSAEIFEETNKYGADDLAIQSPAQSSRKGAGVTGTGPCPENGNQQFRQPRFSESQHRPVESGTTDPAQFASGLGREDLERVHNVSGRVVSPRAGWTPQSKSAAPVNYGVSPAVPAVDSYISSFEQQMFQVLDEWRKQESA